ncbi:hypothetical protein Btru_074809 [Bulinus truncatus]|nr:hypothetical protein Btru_074809 [Bulinus truncatus]
MVIVNLTIVHKRSANRSACLVKVNSPVGELYVRACGHHMQHADPQDRCNAFMSTAAPKTGDMKKAVQQVSVQQVWYSVRCNKCRYNKCRYNKCRYNKCQYNKCQYNKCLHIHCSPNKGHKKKVRVHSEYVQHVGAVAAVSARLCALAPGPAAGCPGAGGVQPPPLSPPRMTAAALGLADMLT